MNNKERFWSKVNIKDLLDCWEWTATKTPNGYGQFTVDRKKIQTHRLAWEFTYGKIPEGLCVLHKCDNKACVNPAHLFIGTHNDNMQDMIKKNRQSHNTGQLNGNNKLTQNQVLEIRLSSDTIRNLSKRFDATL